MSEETVQISDLMPPESEFSMDGQFSLNGQFSIDCTYASKIGDLFHTGFYMKSDYGNAEVSTLGQRNYTAIWETYQYKPGMINTAHLDQPLAALCFQLEGSAQAIQSSTDFKLDIFPGEANLMMIPPLSETFELKEEMGGTSFMVILSQGYLQDLSSRFPNVFEPIISKIKRKNLGLYKEKNLRMTPRMRSIIKRIQHPVNNDMVGSLFLEAQILDLLAIMFSQKEETSSNGHSLTALELERINRAKEILTDRLEDPPTLAELSKLIGTNEFKLKSGFKEVFGTSPYAYHLQHKLELAKSYILDTDLTIAEIGYRVGYSDPAHFTNAFRKQFDIRPSDLR